MASSPAVEYLDYKRNREKKRKKNGLRVWLVQVKVEHFLHTANRSLLLTLTVSNSSIHLLCQNKQKHQQQSKNKKSLSDYESLSMINIPCGGLHLLKYTYILFFK